MIGLSGAIALMSSHRSPGQPLDFPRTLAGNLEASGRHFSHVPALR